MSPSRLVAKAGIKEENPPGALLGSMNPEPLGQRGGFSTLSPRSSPAEPGSSCWHRDTPLLPSWIRAPSLLCAPKPRCRNTINPPFLGKTRQGWWGRRSRQEAAVGSEASPGWRSPNPSLGPSSGTGDKSRLQNQPRGMNPDPCPHTGGNPPKHSRI